jgi:hypothetical protein
MTQGLLFPEEEKEDEELENLMKDLFKVLKMQPTDHIFDNLPDDIKQYFNHKWDKKNKLIDGDDVYDRSVKKAGCPPVKEEYLFLGNNRDCDCTNLPRKSMVYLPLRLCFMRKTGETDQIGRRRTNPKYIRDDAYMMCYLDEWIGKEICGIKITDSSRRMRLAVEKLMQGLIANHFKSFNPNDNYG